MASQKHILVVDDEPIVCTTLKSILSDFGYQVTISHDGFQAKETLITQSFDLIISDISMPGLDGLSLLSHIQEQSPNTPVIILASITDPLVRKRALEQGAKACVDKPIRFQELNTLIETYLSPSQPSQTERLPNKKIAPSPASPATKLNVLIVDDEHIVHETLSGFIQELGHHPHSVYDGTAALQLIETHPFDLALIDVRMPGIDGLELLEHIHKNISNLPVVIMTGHGDPIMSEKAKSLGAYDFVIKPIRLFDLLEMLDQISTQKNNPSKL